MKLRVKLSLEGRRVLWSKCTSLFDGAGKQFTPNDETFSK